jgi:hypothetical protein
LVSAPRERENEGEGTGRGRVGGTKTRETEAVLGAVLADRRSSGGGLASIWRKEKVSWVELGRMARWQLGRVSAVGPGRKEN